MADVVLSKYFCISRQSTNDLLSNKVINIRKWAITSLGVDLSKAWETGLKRCIDDIENLKGGKSGDRTVEDEVGGW